MRLGKTILNSFIFLFNKGWCCKNLIQICLVWQDHRCISCWCLWVTVIPHSWMTWQRQTTVVNLSLPFVRLLHMILMIAIHSVMIYFPSSDLSIRMAWSGVTIISHDACGKKFGSDWIKFTHGHHPLISYSKRIETSNISYTLWWGTGGVAAMSTLYSITPKSWILHVRGKWSHFLQGHH